MLLVTNLWISISIALQFNRPLRTCTYCTFLCKYTRSNPSTFGTSITALKMSENDRRVLWEIHKSTYNMKRPISLYLLPCMLH